MSDERTPPDEAPKKKIGRKRKARAGKVKKFLSLDDVKQSPKWSEYEAVLTRFDADKTLASARLKLAPFLTDVQLPLAEPTSEDVTEFVAFFAGLYIVFFGREDSDEFAELEDIKDILSGIQGLIPTREALRHKLIDELFSAGADWKSAAPMVIDEWDALSWQWQDKLLRSLQTNHRRHHFDKKTTCKIKNTHKIARKKKA